ncbi:hypothetical protein AB0346_09925 [Nocardia beijingensis]|uniref:hypothetical protein n=1 Tax=Nocardia beijingensis TaxID=95162 RepID=UPI00344B9347
MAFKEVKVELGWGPAKASGTWVPDENERAAAWELYVELVTRIAVAPLEDGQGTLREALTSLHQLFAITRDILRRHGPGVARKPRRGRYRFGYLAVWILNAAVRPTLSQWHPELQRWEAQRPATLSVAEHEQQWPKSAELRRELERLRHLLLAYARVLAKVCEAPALIQATDDIASVHRSP